MALCQCVPDVEVYINTYLLYSVTTGYIRLCLELYRAQGRLIVDNI